MGTLLHYILLNEHVIAFKPTAFALAGNMPHPFEGQVGSFGEIAGVFDVIPNTINYFPQFPFDGFGVVYGVQSPTVFDPPEAATEFLRVERAEFGNLLCHIMRKTGRDKGNGFAHVFGIKIEAVPQEFAVGLGRGKFFPKLLLCLRTHAKRSTRQKA